MTTWLSIILHLAVFSYLKIRHLLPNLLLQSRGRERKETKGPLEGNTAPTVGWNDDLPSPLDMPPRPLL